VSSIGKNIMKGLAAIGEAIEQSIALRQEMKEKATLAHLRGEKHDEDYCAVCQATGEEVEYELQECKKHEFGECKANCRYRTGVVEDCTWHANQICGADCRYRRA